MRFISQSSKFGNAAVCTQALLIYAWLTNLQGTDSYDSVYILCAVVGLFCLCRNFRHRAVPGPRTRIGLGLLAGVFSLAVVMANYALFLPVRALESWFNAGLCLLGGYCLGYHILLCGVTALPLAPAEDPACRQHPGRVFWGCFAAVSTVYLLYLFFAAYPGYLSTDSINSLRQIESGEYVNSNPFWYTMVIRACLQAGMALFGEINAAVAVYSTVQILFLAACFAYSLVTLYQMGIGRWWIAAVFGIYAFLPYHLAYSVTMWKDIPFSACVLLWTASLYRIFMGIGRCRRRDYIVFALGGLGVCLMRTNGWFAFLTAGVILWFPLRKRFPDVLKIMGVLVLVCWILINPVQWVLDVEQTDFVEGLALPFQQVARVVWQERPISEADTRMLEEVFHLDRVSELYQPEIVDPIKFEAVRSDGRAHLKENLWDYFCLWLRLGLQYPGDYFQAWVELTKGFWNGGYAFWIYFAWTWPESSGIGGFELDNPVKDGFDALFRYLEKPAVFQPLFSIGLHTWLVVSCCFICAAGKRREGLMTVLVLVILAGLWVGTPVYAEYRYAYPMFTTYPLILLATVFQPGLKKPPCRGSLEEVYDPKR